MLVVEDGTNVSDADAFVSLAYADSYNAAMGNDAWATYSDADKETAIRRGTAFLSTAYDLDGNRTFGRSQVLAWPRSGMVDADGNVIAKDEMPVEIMDATCEAAKYEAGNQGGLNEIITMTDRVKREKVGSLEVEYAGAPGNAEAARPILTKLENLIAPFIVGPKTSGGSGFLERG